MDPAVIKKRNSLSNNLKNKLPLVILFIVQKTNHHKSILSDSYDGSSSFLYVKYKTLVLFTMQLEPLEVFIRPLVSFYISSNKLQANFHTLLIFCNLLQHSSDML